MSDREADKRPVVARGCLATGIAAVALAVLSPLVFAVQSWKRWRRGTEIRARTHSRSLAAPARIELREINVEFDVPGVAEADFRGRLTEAVVRMADSMRAPDDVYHLVYRLPWDTEPVLLPVGPQLQELGERFSLLQSRGGMAGRTAVWLTLGREHALAEIVDPVGYDPEAAGEPEGLLTHPALRWSMATEWVRIGPSLLVRLMIVVPAHHARRVTEILDDVA
jgi:hypothetical protein